MGMFDNFKKGDNIKITPKVALALASITVIAADGEVDDQEIQSILRLMQGDNSSLQDARKIYVNSDISYQTIIEKVSNSLNENQKLATLANLVDIAMADGILAGNEEELLNGFLNEFNLPEEKEQLIIDVIGLKNNLSVFE
jgi:uncharacterized tellurite resistance protein B-like protein